MPIVSIVGYTNAGKSTLLNTLTHADVIAEDKLFATLDPRSRRLRFPEEREVVITDTVGFIRDLPEELLRAFRATFEEVEEADLILHVVDASDPSHDQHIATTEGLLRELDLERIPRLLVMNKFDLLDAGAQKRMTLGRGTPSCSSPRRVMRRRRRASSRASPRCSKPAGPKLRSHGGRRSSNWTNRSMPGAALRLTWHRGRLVFAAPNHEEP